MHTHEECNQQNGQIIATDCRCSALNPMVQATPNEFYALVARNPPNNGTVLEPDEQKSLTPHFLLQSAGLPFEACSFWQQLDCFPDLEQKKQMTSD